MKTDISFIHGTQVMLLGTSHTRIDDNRDFNPRNQEEYKVLNNFKPEIVFVELTERKNIDAKSKNFTDIASIYQYKLENNIQTINYDSETQEMHLHYVVYRPDDLEEKIDKVKGDTDKFRQVLKEEYPEMFYDIYEQRENKSVTNFFDEIGNHNRLAIHCGLKHYNTYKNFFEFMSRNY
jgi:hypothetical protein